MILLILGLESEGMLVVDYVDVGNYVFEGNSWIVGCESFAGCNGFEFDSWWMRFRRNGTR